MLESLWQDVRYGVRLLWGNPGFAIFAVVSLVLGIGANAAIFQLLDAVRLRSLPVERPSELAEIRIKGGNTGMGLNEGFYGSLTRPIWQEIQRNQKAFTGVFAWQPNGVRVGQGTESMPADALLVSGDFFRVLGVHPWRGRLLTAADETPTCPSRNAVVSYRYWQARMGGRELGDDSRLFVDGERVQVVGVTPPEFLGLAVGQTFDIVGPFCQPKELRRDEFEVTVMGRLKPGWTLERASASMDELSPGIFAATAVTGYAPRLVEKYKSFRLAAYPASGGKSALREQYDSSLWMLLGITALVLLIACANLANLMLARASVRAREVAVRLALGASRGRLLRQFLVESLLLAITGAVLGAGFAAVLSRALVWSLSNADNPISLPMQPDWRVLAYVIGVAAATCIVFGVAPALSATKADPVTAMKSGARGTTGGRERYSMQRLMVVAQIAVSLVLLVGALLFVRSFRNLMSVNPGMREHGVAIAFLGFNQSHVAPEGRAEFKRELLDQVRSVPGVLSAATTTNIPLSGQSWSHAVHVGATEGNSQFQWVSPGYFQTMGIPLLTGRDINTADTSGSQRVVVVNQAFVKRYFGSANPTGKTLQTVAEPDYPSTVYQVVGVIPNTLYNDIRGETRPMAFAPATQFPAERPWTAMMIHSEIPASLLSAAVKRKIAERHPEIIIDCRDFEGNIQGGLVRERMMAMLSGFFGVLALLLAMAGLYGVISYVVARRTNEIGIRVALGARQGQVIAMVLREAGWLLVAGTVAGITMALIAGRGASSLLFGLKPYDPLTIGTAAGLLAVIAVLASLAPARRASKVDPMVALRYE
jgi:predicted permease